jgi:hypothetical protein
MNTRLNPFYYIVPCGLLLFLIHDFYAQGHLNLYQDAKTNCIYTNYFLNNIMRGVYPFWNPFTSWGRPDDLLARMMGDFNPFLYLIVLFEKLGLRFSLAYFMYLIFYFALGMAGVFALAKQLFKEPAIAWLTCLAAMFSNLTGNLFNNIFVILIFVPTVWFFYFLVRLARDPQRPWLLGLVFSVMIILTTYMPFHFLVVLLTFLAFYTCIYFREIPSIFQRCVIFIFKNKLFTLFCLFSLLLAAIPGWTWYESNLKEDIVYGWRGTQKPLFLDQNMINTGNFITTHALISPASNLHDAELSNLYIPFVFILIALAGMVLPLTRRRVLLFSLGLFIFLMTMTNASPVMGFLYDHIFFIKHFRNTHFFVWAFDMVLILLVMDLLEGLLTMPLKSSRQRLGLCVLIIVLHLFILKLLNQAWGVNWSSYLVLALSCLFFVLYFSGVLKSRNPVFFLILATIILFQPIEAVWHVDLNAAGNDPFPYSSKPYSFEESKPVFSYLRPTLDEELQGPGPEHRGDIRDQSGLMKDMGQYQGTSWSFAALQGFPAQKLQEYVRHKFVLYPPDQNVSIGPSDDFPSGQWVDQASDQFKVTAFDMNYIRIKTNFSQDQLLVYNDSYQAGWRASINGRPVPIIRANMAFKGIHLPAGPNDILFSYHSAQYRIFFTGLIFYFQFILGFLIFLFLKRRGNAVAA